MGRERAGKVGTGDERDRVTWSQASDEQSCGHSQCPHQQQHGEEFQPECYSTWSQTLGRSAGRSVCQDSKGWPRGLRDEAPPPGSWLERGTASGLSPSFIPSTPDSHLLALQTKCMGSRDFVGGREEVFLGSPRSLQRAEPRNSEPNRKPEEGTTLGVREYDHDWRKTTHFPKYGLQLSTVLATVAGPRREKRTSWAGTGW